MQYHYHCFFRADSGNIIGMGHLTRCLNLIDNIRNKYKYFKFYLIQKNHISNSQHCIPEWIKHIKLPLTKLVDDHHSTWLGSSSYDDYTLTWNNIQNELKYTQNSNHKIYLFADHYAIDIEWESFFISKVDKLVVIDDFNNRQHNCHYLINSSITNVDDNLINSVCTKLIGPSYIILSNKLLNTNLSINYRWPVKHILVSFGGYDTTDHSIKILNILKQNIEQTNKFIFHFVMGYSTKYNELKQYESDIFKFYSYIDLYQMYQFIDLSICSNSSSCFDKCYMQIPMIGISVVENQINIGILLSSNGCLVDLTGNEFNLMSTLDDICQNKEQFIKMKNNCKIFIQDAISNKLLSDLNLLNNNA